MSSARIRRKLGFLPGALLSADAAEALPMSCRNALLLNMAMALLRHRAAVDLLLVAVQQRSEPRDNIGMLQVHVYALRGIFRYIIQLPVGATGSRISSDRPAIRRKPMAGHRPPVF